MMFEQCNIVIFNNIIFMKKHRKFSGKIRWKFSEIFRKNMKFSGQIFHLTSLISLPSDIRISEYSFTALPTGGIENFITKLLVDSFDIAKAHRQLF